MVESVSCEGNWSLFSITPEIPAELLSESLKSPSAIRYAYDMGVLELLGLSLTVLGVVIAIAALFGFWVYGHIVSKTATRETREIAPEVIADLLGKDPELWVRVIRENPALFQSAIQQAVSSLPVFDSGLDDRSVDQIAEEAGSEENDKPA